MAGPRCYKDASWPLHSEGEIMSGLTQTLGLAALLAIAVAVLAAWHHLTTAARRKRKKRFQSREVPSFDQWYARYYGDPQTFPPQQVRAILEMFAEEIGVKRTQLLPSDCLHDDFSLCSRLALDESWLEWSSELAELAADCGGPALALDPGWRTLDDLIRGVIGQIRAHPAAGVPDAATPQPK
jgi:hypothetical protein